MPGSDREFWFRSHNAETTLDWVTEIIRHAELSKQKALETGLDLTANSSLLKSKSLYWRVTH